MGHGQNGAERRRYRRRAEIRKRYEELRDEPASARIRAINEEFGPYWFIYLNPKEPFPDELRRSPRYVEWLGRRNQAYPRKGRDESHPVN